MQIICRLAKSEDCEQIANLTLDLTKGSFEDHLHSVFVQIKENKLEDSLTKVFVAIVEGKVVARAKLFYYDDRRIKVDFESPRGWYFNGAIVEEKFRRKGIAKSLASFRENYIKQSKKDGEKVYSIVSAVNEASIKYHQAVDFLEQKRALGFLCVRLECGEGILFKKYL